MDNDEKVGGINWRDGAEEIGTMRGAKVQIQGVFSYISPEQCAVQDHTEADGCRAYQAFSRIHARFTLYWRSKNSTDLPGYRRTASRPVDE